MNPLKASLHLILFLTLTFVVIGQFATASPSAEKQQLPLPKVPAKAHIKPDDTPQVWQKHQITIQKNGSLSQALDTLGIHIGTTYKIANTKNGEWLTQLRSGDALQVWLDDKQQLQKIFYPKYDTVHYQLTRDVNDDFRIEKIDLPVETKVETATGIIQHSFYISAEEAGLSAKTIMNLADIFGWEIDFIRQLRPGKPFKVIYEKKYINGRYIGDGDILAAEIVTAGDQRHTAFLLKDKHNEPLGYFDENRHNLRKAFLRNPVDYVRITSRYKPKRFHPVLKKWRAHRGVDYGGPIGTPIRVTGDGQIIKRQWNRSYGRVIFVKHAGKYTTVYAHMSKFGKYKQGDWVRQGQVIGYIGQTGLATGPHLHYEFRENGRHVDPLRVKFPDAGPVPKQYHAEFDRFSELMLAQMERLNPHTQLAANFE